MDSRQRKADGASSIERYSTREEQWPEMSEQVEQIAALSSEQMGMG